MRAIAGGPSAVAPTADPRPIAVRLEVLRKTFGDVIAVANVDLDVYEGESFSPLGPSGSGRRRHSA